MVNLKVGVAAVVLGNHRFAWAEDDDVNDAFAVLNDVPDATESVANVYLSDTVLYPVLYASAPMAKIAMVLFDAPPSRCRDVPSDVPDDVVSVENVHFTEVAVFADAREPAPIIATVVLNPTPHKPLLAGNDVDDVLELFENSYLSVVDIYPAIIPPPAKNAKVDVANGDASAMAADNAVPAATESPLYV